MPVRPVYNQPGSCATHLRVRSAIAPIKIHEIIKIAHSRLDILKFRRFLFGDKLRSSNFALESLLRILRRRRLFLNLFRWALVLILILILILTLSLLCYEPLRLLCLLQLLHA